MERCVFHIITPFARAVHRDRGIFSIAQKLLTWTRRSCYSTDMAMRLILGVPARQRLRVARFIELFNEELHRLVPTAPRLGQRVAEVAHDAPRYKLYYELRDLVATLYRRRVDPEKYIMAALEYYYDSLTAGALTPTTVLKRIAANDNPKLRDVLIERAETIERVERRRRKRVGADRFADDLDEIDRLIDQGLSPREARAFALYTLGREFIRADELIAEMLADGDFQGEDEIYVRSILEGKE